MKLNYFEINAFVGQDLLGNPAGVCPLNEWLPDQLMQQIAAQNNLSETAFFVPEADGFRLRWFTTKSEVDLCGHATLASSHVLWQHLGHQADAVKFHTCSGVLEVARRGELISLNFPARPGNVLSWDPIFENVFRPEHVDHVQISRDIMFVLKNENQVRQFIPDFAEISKLDGYGMIITAPGESVDFVSRFFIPHDSLPEDPVTGSTHCTLVPYWATRLGKETLVAQQISERGGELYCCNLGDRVEIAGRARTYLVGTIEV